MDDLQEGRVDGLLGGLSTAEVTEDWVFGGRDIRGLKDTCAVLQDDQRSGGMSSSPLRCIVQQFP